MKDPRYAAWLQIASDLEVLHAFAYGEVEPLSRIADANLGPSSGPVVAQWIRRKCETGWWYWWDKGWLGGKAEEPLRSFDRLTTDANGLYEETENGRELIDRVADLKERIAKLTKA